MSIPASISKYLPRKSRLIVALATIGLAVAGCGSSGSSTTSGAGAGSTSSTTASSTSSPVAAARAAVARYSVAPTKIGITVPLKATPPKGKTFIYLQCELAQCQSLGTGAIQATNLLGWHYRAIPYQSADPSTLVAGLKQALQYKPVAVGISALPEPLWQSVIPMYAAAKVPIVTVATGPVTFSSTVIANALAPSDFTTAGTIIGNWFIADSDGKGHALLVDVPSYPTLKAATDGTAAVVTKSCPACSLKTLNLTLAQLASNSVVSSIVATVQQDPSIKYVITSDGAFVQGLAAALKTAGVTGVKIAGNAPTVVNEQNLLTASEAAWTGQNYVYPGWQLVDAALRHLEGMPVPDNEGPAPQELLTKANVGTPSNGLNAPPDLEAQFKALWKLS